MVHWKDLRGNIIDNINLMPEGTVGFVYLITTPEGSYIGRKSTISKTKRNFGKKELATITDKRLKTYEIVIKESNWKKYAGSNKELTELIKNGVEYTKVILDYAFSKKHLTYIELKYLFKYAVIEPNDNPAKTRFFNDNINGTFFRKDFYFEKD
jgi:hypothetical protein